MKGCGLRWKFVFACKLHLSLLQGESNISMQSLTTSVDFDRGYRGRIKLKYPKTRITPYVQCENILYSLRSFKICSWSLRFRQLAVCQVNTSQSCRLLHSCLLNQAAQFSTKIFAHFWDIVIFVLKHFKVNPVNIHLLTYGCKLHTETRKCERRL